MFSLKTIACLVVFCCLYGATGYAQATDTAQRIVEGRRNSPAQQEKPYVILISADGFRYDYARQYQATALLQRSRQGVTAPYMIPSFPSLTFPNHYTLATGLYPAQHGLVNNSFYDRERGTLYTRSRRTIAEDPYYYGGEPLWVLAEKQQMLSACFYWVGSEVPVQGILPTYHYAYNEMIPLEKRLQTVKQWLQLPAAQRPHLITFYLPQVDQEGHQHGPDSKETIGAIKLIDQAIGRLCSMVDSLRLPVNYVFVSDHGMALADTARIITPPAADTAQFITVVGDVLINYYAKDKAYIPALYQRLKATARGYDVYLPDETPAHWHYRKADDRYHRIGDIILVARYPQLFSWTSRRINPGRHGYDPRTLKAMNATFIAWGPAFKKKARIAPFENIHIYGLVAQLLGLQGPGSEVKNAPRWESVLK